MATTQEAKEYMDMRVPVEGRKGTATYRGKLVGHSSSGPRTATFSLQVEGSEKVVSGIRARDIRVLARR